MSFLRKRSRSQCSFSLGDDHLNLTRTEQQDFDRTSRSETFNSARASCSEADSSDFAVQDSCVFRNFPQHKSSHLRFLAWVAYTRRFTDEWISEDERRTCPLLWCRAVFKDQESMLHHVWNCQHLSKGLYWCFHCQKPERVGKARCRKCQGLPTRADRVASVARRIFSKLGAKALRHEHANLESQFGRALPNVAEDVTMPDSSPYPNEKAPLPENGPVDQMLQTPQELPDTSVLAEMPGDWMEDAVELQGDSQILEMTGAEGLLNPSNEAEIWPDNFYAESLEEWDVPLPVTSKARGRSPKLAIDTSVPPTISLYHEQLVLAPRSNWMETPMSNTLISPLSPEGPNAGLDLGALDISPTDTEASGHSFFTDSGYSSTTSFSWSFTGNGLSRNSSVESRKGKEIHRMEKIPEFRPAQPVYARPVTLPEPPTNLHQLSRHVSDASDRPHGEDSCTPSLRGSVDLLKSFCDALDMHISHTQTALRQMPKSSIISELLTMSRTSMVSIGLDSLAGILEGRNPRTIVQVFAFTHVACAAAISVDGVLAKVHTQAWFHDSLAWIPERQRPLYIQIAKCIWAPPALQDIETPAMAKNNASHRNLILGACKDFLHIFEHSQMLEINSTLNVSRTFNFAQTSFERNAKLMIIDELIKTPSIEAFIGTAMQVERRLLQGHITSMRGLELELLCTGQRTSQSVTAYDRFQEHVTRLCNTLNANEPPRISHYIRDISNIKYLAPEKSHIENLGAQSREADIESFAQLEVGVHSEASRLEAEDDPLEHFDFDSFERDADEALRRNDYQFPPAVDSAEVYLSSAPAYMDQHLNADLPHPVQGYYSNYTTPITSHPASPSLQPLASPQPPQPAHHYSTGPSQLPPAAVPMVAATTYRCHCGYVPTGEEKWKASNLRRHKRIQHPVEAKTYACEFPGCTSHFSRSDNLRDHQRRKGHEVVLGMAGGHVRGSGSKRRKVSAGDKER